MLLDSRALKLGPAIVIEHGLINPSGRTCPKGPWHTPQTTSALGKNHKVMGNSQANCQKNQNLPSNYF
jgi:hypothetical protein